MKLTNYDTAFFLEQLSMIVECGLSVEEGIETIQQQTEDKGINEMLDNLKGQLEMGYSLSHSLSELKVFDDYVINLVDIGEKTGYLDNTLKQLSIYYYRLDNVKHKVKDAVTYPFILLVMMIVVMLVLIIKVLPVFRDVLNSLGAELSTSALFLMELGQNIAKYGFGIAIVISIIIIGALVYLFIKYKDDASKILLEKNFLTRRLSDQIAVSKFAYALSLLLNSGYDLRESLNEIPNMLENEKVIKKIKVCVENIEEGIDTALVNSGIFKPMYNQMIKLSFKTGKLDETMTKIAVESESEVDSAINKFLNIIEPSLIVVTVGIVGIILLSVMLPLLSLMSSI